MNFFERRIYFVRRCVCVSICEIGILCLSDECRTSTVFIRLRYSLQAFLSCHCVGIGFQFRFTFIFFAIVIGTIHIALKSVSRWHNGPWHSWWQHNRTILGWVKSNWKSTLCMIYYSDASIDVAVSYSIRKLWLWKWFEKKFQIHLLNIC